MKKYKAGKQIKRILLLVGCLLLFYANTMSVYATNISTLPDNSGNDVPPETQAPIQDVPVEPPVTEAPPVEPAPQESDVRVEPVPEVSVGTEEPVDPGSDDLQSPEESASDAGELSTEETDSEESTAKADVSSSEEEQRETETIESSEAETWPMGFSGAGDGQTTQEDQTAETAGQEAKKEGAGTIAKVFAAIFMVLLIGGVVAYGYISMTSREELRRRERRARAWNDYDDEDDE